MDTRKPLTYVLVKPSGPDCNLACSYCFYSRNEAYFPAGGKHRMDRYTLEELIRQSLNRPGGHMAFGWQGGEPTLMGLAFYEEAVELEKKYGGGMHVSNSIQTNGLLIDDRWIDFFRRHSFLVGLSLDGPAHIHDHYRIHRDGTGTHGKVERVALDMLEAQVTVNALSVITEYSSSHAAENYRYLKDLGFTYMQFIPCMEMDPAGSGSVAEFSVASRSYGKFLCELFDAWADDFTDGCPAVSVRQFDTFAAVYLGQPAPECTARSVCGDYVVVEHTGDVYSCDFFVEDAWHLGSLHGASTLEEMLNSKRQILFGKRKSLIDDRCRRCSWLAFCRGGCPKDRLRNPATRRFNPFCESYKIFFEYADKRFGNLMREFSRQRQLDGMHPGQGCKTKPGSAMIL